MFKSSFANGLLNNSDENIAEYLVSWDRIGVFTQLYNKVGDFIQGFFNSEEEIRKDEAKKFLRQKKVYLSISSSKSYLHGHLFYLHGLLFLRICESFDMAVTAKITSLRELDDILLSLENKCVNFQKELNKDAKMKKFKGNSFSDLRKHYLDFMISEFKKLSKDKQEKILEDVVQKLNSLSEDELNNFKKKMNIDKISKRSINNIILTGGVYSAIAGTVGLVGFPAYIFLVSFIKGVASLIGVGTLPFGVYKAATVSLSFLTAWFAPIFLVGGLIFFGNKQNEKMDKIYSSITMVTTSFQSIRDLKDDDIKHFIESINRKINE